MQTQFEIKLIKVLKQYTELRPSIVFKKKRS